MVEIYGIKFRSSFELAYYFLNNVCCNVNQNVLCRTKHGLEFGTITLIKTVANVDYCDYDVAVEGFVRIATSSDENSHKQNLVFEKDAMAIGKKCVQNFNLKMKLNLVVSTFDRTKLIFFFTSNGRVDFRKLVRYMASIFKTRVELHQIGIRDEAKMLSGIGVCGREFCCASFLNQFNHISIKMAKIQNLSLSPRKISGCCGRLMCCLCHEQDAYVDLNNKTPKVGAQVLTPNGVGVVVSRNLLLGELKVKLSENSNLTIKVFNVNQIKIL